MNKWGKGRGWFKHEDARWNECCSCVEWWCAKLSIQSIKRNARHLNSDKDSMRNPHLIRSSLALSRFIAISATHHQETRGQRASSQGQSFEYGFTLVSAVCTVMMVCLLRLHEEMRKVGCCAASMNLENQNMPKAVRCQHSDLTFQQRVTSATIVQHHQDRLAYAQSESSTSSDTLNLSCFI